MYSAQITPEPRLLFDVRDYIESTFLQSVSLLQYLPGASLYQQFLRVNRKCNGAILILTAITCLLNRDTLQPKQPARHLAHQPIRTKIGLRSPT